MDFGQIQFGIYPQGLNIMLNSRTKRKNESSDCTLAVKVLLFKADNIFFHLPPFNYQCHQSALLVCKSANYHKKVQIV